MDAILKMLSNAIPELHWVQLYPNSGTCVVQGTSFQIYCTTVEVTISWADPASWSKPGDSWEVVVRLYGAKPFYRSPTATRRIRPLREALVPALREMLREVCINMGEELCKRVAP